MKSFWVKNSKLIASYIEILVDDEDYDRVMNYNWNFNHHQRGGIRCSSGEMRGQYLSRFILNIVDPKIEIDHKNHNKFDNRKENLRICNKFQNSLSKKIRKGKKFKGIYLNKKNNRWIAQIMHFGRNIYLGSFLTAEEAAKAYDEGAKLYFGEFATLNFPNP